MACGEPFGMSNLEKVFRVPAPLSVFVLQALELGAGVNHDHCARIGGVAQAQAHNMLSGFHHFSPNNGFTSALKIRRAAAWSNTWTGLSIRPKREQTSTSSFTAPLGKVMSTR